MAEGQMSSQFGYRLTLWFTHRTSSLSSVLCRSLLEQVTHDFSVSSIIGEYWSFLFRVQWRRCSGLWQRSKKGYFYGFFYMKGRERIVLHVLKPARSCKKNANAQSPKLSKIIHRIHTKGSRKLVTRHPGRLQSKFYCYHLGLKSRKNFEYHAY